MDCKTLNESIKQDALYGMGSLGVLAALMCLIAVSLVFIFKLYKYFAHRLALYQVLAALSLGTTLALELMFLEGLVDEDSIYCEIIGFFIVYTSGVQLLFTSWIVIHLFCFSVFYKNLQFLEKPFLCISVLLPLLFAWVPFVPDEHGLPAYGSSGAWCWIRSWRNDCIADKFTQGIDEQLGLVYIPIMVCSGVLSLGIIVIISRLLCCQPKDDSSEISLLGRTEQRVKALRELLPLLAYPIIYCILLIPPLINRIYGAISKKLDPILIVISGSFISIPPLCTGLALIIHLCLLKCSKFLKKRRIRQNNNNTGGTINPDQPSTWDHFTQGGYSTRNNMTEAYIPNESEVDKAVLLHKNNQN